MRVQKDGCIIVLYSISSFIPYAKIALAILLSIASTMVLAPLYIHAVKDKQDLKEACINHDEKWRNGECKFPHDNKGEEDKAAYEDYVYDDPEDSKKWRKICG